MSVKYLSRIIAFLLSALMLFVTASFAQTPPFTGEVNSRNINIRSDSTVDAEIICQLDKGTKVEVMSEFYEWYKIRLTKEAPCYVRKDFLKCLNYGSDSYPGSVMPILNKKGCLSAQATKERINVRLRPDESSPVIGRLDNNEVVNISKSTGDWYKIEAIQNSFGWINKRFVNKVSTEKKR
jgi:uncharacterized protein YgiM (DUF1202 family)